APIVRAAPRIDGAGSRIARTTFPTPETRSRIARAPAPIAGAAPPIARMRIPIGRTRARIVRAAPRTVETRLPIAPRGPAACGQRRARRTKVARISARKSAPAAPLRVPVAEQQPPPLAPPSPASGGLPASSTVLAGTQTFRVWQL